MELEDQLSSVHDAIQDASLEARPETPKLVVGSYKVDPRLKHAAQEICQTNGTTLSSFLKHCVTRLVRDYSPESAQLPRGEQDS